MFGDASFGQGTAGQDDAEATGGMSLQTAITGICIPKREPCDSRYNSKEDLSSIDTLEPLIPFTTPYKLKDPVIVLERCDKIWKTLKLIKALQSTSDNAVDNVADHADDCMEDSASVETATQSNNPDTVEAGSTYIKYQPTMGNTNKSLPNFTLSVKAKQRLHHCLACGKQYTKNVYLREHSRKVHGVIMLSQRELKAGVSTSNEVVEEMETEKYVFETEQDSTGICFTEKSMMERTNKSRTMVPLALRHEKTGASNQIQNATKDGLICSNNSTDITQASRKGNERSRAKNSVHMGAQYPVNKQCQFNEQFLSSNQELLDHSIVLCLLCDRYIKNIKIHLMKFHKINCPQMMMKELSRVQAFAVDGKAENKNSVRTDRKKVAKTPEALLQKPYPSINSNSHVGPDNQNVKKRKQRHVSSGDVKRKCIANNTDNLHERNVVISSDANNSTVPNYACHLCPKTYHRKLSLALHQRIHKNHTKETVSRHESDPPAANSQMVSFNKSATDTPVENSRLSDNTAEEETTLGTSNETEGENSAANGGEQTICTCGRSFRNPHTLFVHKNKCKMQSDSEEEQAARSSSDRDSGIGISITIKKKNDSYEIVGKDNGDESTAEDYNELKDCDAVSDASDRALENSKKTVRKEEEFHILESSKYSKDHSILKLAPLEEDIVVDIEDDVSNFDDDKQGESCPSVVMESDANDNEDIRNLNVDGDLDSSKNLDGKFVSSDPSVQQELNIRSSTVLSMKQDDAKFCVCGKAYEDEASLNNHMSEDHPLLLKCGYCKRKFKSIKAVSGHRCSVIQEGQREVDHCFGSCDFHGSKYFTERNERRENVTC